MSKQEIKEFKKKVITGIISYNEDEKFITINGEQHDIDELIEDYDGAEIKIELTIE